MENNNFFQDTQQENSSSTNVTNIDSEDVKNTVRSFVLGWIRGDVTIEFPDTNHIIAINKSRGKKCTFEEAFQIEMSSKSQFRKNIEVFTGSIPSTPEQQKEATSWLFQKLMVFRCGERITGTFSKKDNYEARIGRLEEQMEAVNNLLQELVITVRSIQKR